MLPQNWHIRSRNHSCTLSGQPFTEGETIVSALFPDPESSGYLRQDFSLQSWEQRNEEEIQPFSSWQSVFELPQPKKKEEPLKRNDPESLLRQLVEKDEEHTENIRYILAVMLERKKLLKEIDARPIGEGILRVYEHRKTGEAFLVRDPNINLDQIEQLQEEVIFLLENNESKPAEEEAETQEKEQEEAAVEEEEVQTS